MIIGLGIGIPFNLNQISRLYSPLSLFANGEQGAWYDPSDLSTLFQDAAGTTPVTAVEQPVGLMLDKSRGLVLGPELFSDFTSEGAWTDNGNGSWSITNAASSTDLRVDYSGTAGKTYRISLTVTNNSGGNLGVFPLHTSPSGFYNGTHNIRMLSNAGFFIIRASMGVSGTVSNISVRELPGAHAFQTTATSRPVLSARVNLLTKTEQFDDDAAWLKSGVTLTSNAGANPIGGSNATRLVGTGTWYAQQNHARILGVQYTVSIYVKSNTGANQTFRLYGQNMTVGSDLVATSVWQRFSLTFTSVGTDSTTGSGITRDAANTSADLLIWGADLLPANQANPPYQRVNTATDYDSDPAKFTRYLRCDGIDDWMVTGTITPGTDKAQVFAGVRKLSDAPAIFAEMSANYNANAGSFYLVTGNDTGIIGDQNGYTSTARGSASATTSHTAQIVAAAPDEAVLTAIHDIAGDLSSIRRNTVAGANGTGDKGTGNFLAYPLYLFRRGGVSLPFNGHFYGGIIRFGPNLPIETIQQTEIWMAAKTGVTL